MPPKSVDPISNTPAPTVAASSTRRKDHVRDQRGRSAITPTIAVSIVMWARILLEKRWPHTDQYCSPRNQATAAASRNPDTLVPRTTARKKVESRRGVSKRAGASLSSHTTPAVTIASIQLVAKSARTRLRGQPVGSSTAMCTGNTGSNTSHQRRGGTNRSAAVRIAFGGQMMEGVAGGTRRRRPRILPR